MKEKCAIPLPYKTIKIQLPVKQICVLLPMSLAYSHIPFQGLEAQRKPFFPTHPLVRIKIIANKFFRPMLVDLRLEFYQTDVMRPV